MPNVWLKKSQKVGVPYMAPYPYMEHIIIINRDSKNFKGLLDF